MGTFDYAKVVNERDLKEVDASHSCVCLVPSGDENETATIEFVSPFVARKWVDCKAASDFEAVIDALRTMLVSPRLRSGAGGWRCSRPSRCCN